MILSEEEARTKWCPWARVVAKPPSVSFNRIDEVHLKEGSRLPDAALCIGMKCMMWRRLGQNSNKVETGCCGLAHPNP